MKLWLITIKHVEINQISALNNIYEIDMLLKIICLYKKKTKQ